jgi:hypothetical protein
MEPNLDQVAKELYGKIQTRFSDIQIADEQAKVLSKKEDIPKARFFEFEYEENGEPLGTIAISLDADDGIVIKASGDLVDDTNPDETHHGAYKFIRSFRKFARQNMLNYEINNMGKSNLDKRDYEFHAKSGEEPMMESKMWGTSRVSYQDLGETRLVVKHSKPVNYDLAAGRTMHIDAIYIENKEGERFRYPVRHLNGARAMAQHIGHGGNPYDEIGQHVVSLSEEMSKLRMFKGYVSRTPVVSEAMGTVNSKVIERIESIKKELHQLQSAKHYETFAEAFAPAETRDIPEEIMLDWVDRLTVRSFKEELKDVFPYIYKLVDESEIPTREIDPDDLLDEAGNPKQAAIAISKKESGKYNKDGKRIKESDQFESFLDSIVGESEGGDALSGDEDALQKLKDEMGKGELKGDPNRIDVIKDLINDPELHGMIADTDPNIDARGIVQLYLQKKNPDIAKQVFPQGMGGSDQSDQPTPPEGGTSAPTDASATPTDASATATPPEGGADASAPPASDEEKPVGETPEDDDLPWHEKTPHDAPKGSFKKPVGKDQGMDRARALAMRAIKMGAKPETKIGDKTLHDMMLELGMDPEDPTSKPMAPAGKPSGDSYDDMMKFASGWWNKEEHNFTIGGEGVKTKLEKQFQGANPADLEKIFANIDRVDPPSSVHGGGHERLKQLAGSNDSGDKSPVPQHGSINESLSIIRKLSGLK